MSLINDRGEVRCLYHLLLHFRHASSAMACQVVQKNLFQINVLECIRLHEIALPSDF